MMKHRRVFAGVLALGMAVMAVTASGATAAAKFTSEISLTSLYGVQTAQNVFSVGSAELLCEEVDYLGAGSGTEFASMALEPAFAKCEFGPFGAATVKASGCDFTFAAATNGGGMGEVGYACSSGRIEIEAAGCTVKITNSQTLNGVSYSNTGSGSSREIDITLTLVNIAYTKTGIACFLISGEGKFGGSITLRGSTGGGTQKGIAWDSM